MYCRGMQGAASWGWNRGGQTARQHSKHHPRCRMSGVGLGWSTWVTPLASPRAQAQWIGAPLSLLLLPLTALTAVLMVIRQATARPVRPAPLAMAAVTGTARMSFTCPSSAGAGPAHGAGGAAGQCPGGDGRGRFAVKKRMRHCPVAWPKCAACGGVRGADRRPPRCPAGGAVPGGEVWVGTPPPPKPTLTSPFPLISEVSECCLHRCAVRIRWRMPCPELKRKCLTFREEHSET